jgi:glycosyltransferase involved in cell wall biosynthesis
VTYSVVIPAHGAAATVADAIQSALGQRLRPHEVLVIDDGSQDQTGLRASQAGATVIRLSVNRGVAAARNVGLSAAKSARVAFLDADDTWLPDHLDAIDAAFDAVPQAVAAFGGVVKTSERHQYEAPQEQPAHVALDLLGSLIQANQVRTSAAAVVRAEALALGGMRTHFAVAEDYDFWLRLAVDRVFVRAEGHTVRYSVHPRQLTADYLRLLESTWQARFEALDSLPESIRIRHQPDVLLAWEKDLSRSWTRRAPAEFDLLLGLADRVPGSTAGLRRWRRRRATLEWLRWPLRLWDRIPETARNRIARWRGRDEYRVLR